MGGLMRQVLCLGEGKEFLFQRWRAQGEDTRKREQGEGDEHHKGLVWKERPSRTGMSGPYIACLSWECCGNQGNRMGLQNWVHSAKWGLGFSRGRSLEQRWSKGNSAVPLQGLLSKSTQGFICRHYFLGAEVQGSPSWYVGLICLHLWHLFTFLIHLLLLVF